MVKFEIRENSMEVSWSNRHKITQGCTVNNDNTQQYPEILESFDNEYDAVKELSKYNSTVEEMRGNTGTYYIVTEYYVEENEYDEDGEWVGGGDIVTFAKLPEME